MPVLSQRRRVLAVALLWGGVALGSAQALEISWGGSAKVTGSGRQASETRAVSGFQAVASRGSVQLVVRQTGKESAEVRADDNVLPLIETVVEQRNGTPTLLVGLKKGSNVSTRNPMVVTVDVAQLSAVSAAGSGDVRIGTLQTPALKLSIAGSADTKIGQLKTEELAIAISGSGDVDAAGQATRVSVKIAGSGDVRLRQLQSDDVSISISGSGDAEVQAAKNLTVSIAGSGDVVYHGDAKLSSRVAGSGSVTRR